MRLHRTLIAALLPLASLAAPVLVAPAAAAVDNSQPGPFIDSLAKDGFAALRSSNHTAAKAQFRQLLSQHFAVDQIGDRLIRRWRPTITPAQYQAYKAAMPTFIINTYADRLFEYADANLKVVRAQQSGDGAAVLSQVTKPGAQPITAVWTVAKTPAGYKVTNLTVGGINLALTQTADFDAFIQRKGFDALVAFMKSRG
ncbi:MlaC/ttg2D family ABC transporter substrate-binding protein [Flavisphingomonas formosensis]|uniref:MlaC/ttg2D family ABC transporter substrate-binding protein n=1 Tax=Flavisphingomonas formosensis TaxID=861534 RepID=UPI0012FACB8C|nr:ABC transporter substrate-binding protein [Sphingomonas formosensis]